jgi:hypothetical protein
MFGVSDGNGAALIGRVCPWNTLVEGKITPSILIVVVEETKMKGLTPGCEQTKINQWLRN